MIGAALRPKVTRRRGLFALLRRTFWRRQTSKSSDENESDFCYAGADRGRRSGEHGLCRAPYRLCAALPGPAALRISGPTGLCAAARGAGTTPACAPDRRGWRHQRARPGDGAFASNGPGSVGAAVAAGRASGAVAWSGVRLGAGLLVLEWQRVALGGRQLGRSALAGRGVGARRLGKARTCLGLAAGALGVRRSLYRASQVVAPGQRTRPAMSYRPRALTRRDLCRRV
jgi:hypothetical protein